MKEVENSETSGSSDISTSKTSSPWLDALDNSVASLYTFSQCTALADLHGDGDSKLIVADLGTGMYNMKLKVFKGTSLMTESAIVDLPTAVVTFYMDANEPKTPAVAVASRPYIYIYKNLRPYYKFTLPTLDVYPVEKDIWNQAKEDKMDVNVLREMLESLKHEHGASVLTLRSLKFLQLDPDEIESFAAVHKHAPLKKQTVITCLSTLKKSLAEDDAISCLVIGSECKDVHILDPEAFTILCKMQLPSVPVFMSISGLYDVEFRILCACRDAKVYSFKKGSTVGKLVIELSSQIVGLERIGKSVVVACMDQTLSSFSSKGKKLWAIHMPATITTTAELTHKSRGFKAVLVALSNAEVRLYKEKALVDLIKVEDIVTGIRFGKFGREDGVLVMTTKGGGLIVKILKRTADFDGKDIRTSNSLASLPTKLNIPRKTKLFVDQALRERESATAMHRAFQQDLQKLRLTTARSYVKSLQTSMNPISSAASDPLKLSAQVQGLGPCFKLIITLQNTSSNVPSQDLLITFHADLTLYTISKAFIEVPLLIPGLEYTYEAFVECVSDKGVAEKIKVFVLHKGNPVPIITAIISMPVSEAVVVV